MEAGPGGFGVRRPSSSARRARGSDVTTAHARARTSLDPLPLPDGNAVDIRYLQEASAALLTIMAATDAAASRGTTNDVRVLARDALSVQTEQLETISSCLLAWGREDGTRPGTTRSEALTGLHGRQLDHAFGDRLAAHARDSIAAAQVEMVSGASRRVRPIAEKAIKAQHHQLASLGQLFPPTPDQHGLEMDRPR